VSASGGTAPYTGTGTFTRSAGTYSFTVTDANSCTATTTGNITQPSAISASETTSPASCNGGSTGSVTVTVSGGTSPYSVTVNGVTHTGVTSSTTFTGLAAGTYPASITDAHGCTGSATGTVGQPTAVTTSSSKTNPLCSSALGSMSVTFSGGTPGYQCSLDGGAFSSCSSPATFNNLAAGSHTVNVKDSHGCTGPAQTQTITAPSAVQASATSTAPTSPGATDGTITVKVSGGTPPYKVTVNGVTHSISTSGGSTTFTGLASGGYNITIVDANGCGLGITTQVAPPPSAQVTLCSILSSLGSGVSTTFKVTLVKGALPTPLTVFYKMSGTAINGVDYKLSGTFGQFTIPAGQTTATVTITALPNPSRTTDRTATMTIVNGPGYFTLSGTNTATVIIRH